MPGSCKGGVNLNKPNDEFMLQQFMLNILCEILTFPTQAKENFIEEYVLPQAYSTILIENGWSGLTFPSTKSYADIQGIHRFSRYNYNFAIFTHYSLENQYDETLMANFIPLINQDNIQTTLLDVAEYMSIITKYNTENGYHPFTNYIINQNIQIDDLQQSFIGKNSYFETAYGQEELKFMNLLYRETISRINTNS